MFRNGSIALLTLLGLVAWSSAQQPTTVPMPTTNLPAIRQQSAPLGSQLQGTWYENGNLGLPATIEVTPRSGRIRRLLLTNPMGQQSNGRIYWRGHTIFAPGWGVRGRFNGNAIYWSNGVYWSR